MKLSFHFDSLSEFFIFAISLATVASAVYSVGYVEEFLEKGENVKLLNLLYSLFYVSMVLVVTAWNGFFFLIVWEIMSVLSYMMVSFNYKNKENEFAGFLYILMTHLGTAFIVISFILLFLKTGSFDFSSFENVSLSYRYALAVAVFALIGFGMKAGIVPFHIWLPYAHPVAPSNVSALMSGVMIKTAIYMLLRFYVDFLPNLGIGFSLFILGIGAVSALLGITYAFTQQDIKKLLAYSSIENIGIIFMGLGLTLLFKATGHSTLYSFALVGTLFHVLNHASFKGLLFLGSGAILKSCHTRDIEKLGGLIKKMPTTALLFLIGSMAICALPPFNGFMSEWVIYQGLLSSFKLSSEAVRLLTPLFAAMLAITGGLALACFVKAFGISFLGNPRSKYAENAEEVDGFMKIGMWILALVCVALGIFPGLVFKLTLGLSGNVPFGNVIQLTSLIDPKSSVSNAFILLALAVVFIASYVLMKADRTVYETWDCGLNEYNPKAQYTATGFAQPIRRIFSSILKPIRRTSVKKKAFKYYTEHLEVEEEITPIFEKYFYFPAARFINAIADFVRSRVHCGNLHAYLFYIASALIVTLIYVIER
jgi:hydrogenase-4 component B